MEDSTIKNDTSHKSDKSKTDLERLKTMTDSDIEKAIQDDPDAAPLAKTEEDLKKYKVNLPRANKYKKGKHVS